jgi:hypothetical protein
MGFSDIVWTIVIVGGALWLLYHSLWKKKGHCSGSGCDGGSCGKK